ncbi:DUF2062 domain-containing protein [Pedomonas sp. V897]|uniref:DUF2062 domain-containing protein n=1 Tax=Pedomonas sp. V897 TaxID=3446482 RepID=UPI003EE09BC6
MSFWKKRLPKREEILASRAMRPFARHFAHGSLWHLNRRSVARGVAIGMLFAFITPVAQTVFAALASVPFRANVAVAALATFITNPITTPPILFIAHTIGMRTLHVFGLADEHQEVLSSLSSLWSEAPMILGATAIGLVVIGLVSALISYFVVDMIWRWRLAQRWRSRRG